MMMMMHGTHPGFDFGDAFFFCVKEEERFIVVRLEGCKYFRTTGADIPVASSMSTPNTSTHPLPEKSRSTSRCA